MFPTWSPAARHNRIKRALSNREIIRLTRGLYCFSENYQRHGLNLFEIGNRIEFPSYVSLESALRHYKLIPEAVIGSTLVTPNRSKEIETPLGVFSFKHLPLRIFQRDFLRKKEGASSFLIATPMKALLDLIYLQQKNYKSLGDLEEDLRLNLEQLKIELRDISNKNLVAYKSLYSRPRVSSVIDLIIWELL